MRTIILSLQDAVETGLKDIDLLEKQDKVIFVYLKGKDTISIPVHNALSQLKCKIEFYEIPDENAKKEDMPIYFAYLAGSNPGAAIIDTGATFTKLTYLGISRFADFKSLANGKSVRKPKETVTGEQPVRKRKPRITESPAFNVIDAPVEKKKPRITESPAFNAINPPEAEEKPKTGKKSVQKEKTDHSAVTDINDLKAYLKNCATESFDPSVSAMSIYEAVKKTITDGIPLNQALEETLFIEGKIKLVNDSLQGKWQQVTDMVREILRQKGQ